ncbi:MAG: class I SAM-dependent methyltransferase [Xanthomonadaceae bacterium]|nr:class I SAM-dependent methyltransferase [Xanthomonadaceae bacterium]
MQLDEIARLGSSFRDPAGFMFTHEGTLYRQVNRFGSRSYDGLMESGLYAKLCQKGWIVAHEEVDAPVAEREQAHKIIKPEPVPFISFPYEWSFGQLKAAAIRTLDIQLAALKHDMILKDASAYNIQFCQGRPVLIDTLSFDPYTEGQTWDGYKQLCQHFLAPLCLMARRDIRLGQLARVHIDGVPLDLASKLMPRSSWLRPGILMHLHLHARAQAAYGESDTASARKTGKTRPLSRNGLVGIVSGLRSLIDGLDWKPAGTEWADYYQATNYSDDAFTAKSRHINAFLDQIEPRQVWDLGANTGHFSRLASDREIDTVAFDIDPAAVEINFRHVQKKKEPHLLPLVLDLTNPSPAMGWAGQERESLLERGPVDCVMALALIHHLAISNNVSLDRTAEFFARACRHLIIEFVPKSDSQVERLLSSRKDIFHHYHEDGFEKAFLKWFDIRERKRVEGSSRTLYWLSLKPS